MQIVPNSQDRLYRELARTLIGELRDGVYPIGTRMPAERELALEWVQLGRSGPERRLKALKIASPATFRALSRYRARGDACAFGWGLQDFRHCVSSSVTE